MKKTCLLLIMLSVLVFTAVSCTNPASNDAVLENTVETEATEQTQTTTAPAEIPSFAPEPTPDIDPFSKMQLSVDEINKLIDHWSITEIDVSQQGRLDSLSLNARTGLLNLNYKFVSDNSTDEIKNLYAKVIEGEWEDSEYSSPVLSGTSSSGESVMCQVTSTGSSNEIYVYILNKNNEDFESFDVFFGAKWPIGVIPIEQSMTGDGSKALYISYPELSYTYSKGYSITNSPAEIIEYYHNILQEYENYMVNDNYDGTKTISCSSDGIDIGVSYSEFSEEIVLTYTVGMLEQ